MIGSNKPIYLDHAAATPMDRRVLDAMKPWMMEEFANPSSLYSGGVKARKAVEDSRKTIADIFHTNPDSIVFTSGGTEGNNLALFGVLGKFEIGNLKLGEVRPHVITTTIEHDSVLRPIQELEKRGSEVSYLPVDEYGLVTVEQVKKALRPDTVLVSIMYANNEVGTIQSIADIGRMIMRYRKEQNSPYPLFHTDACQAVNYLLFDVEKLHVDLMTINGSKIYGPKGVGVLYIRRGVQIEPIMFGGGQEGGLRSGTENVAGIVGMAEAMSLNAECRMQNVTVSAGSLLKIGAEYVGELRDYFWKRVSEEIEDVVLNGPPIKPVIARSLKERPIRLGSGQASNLDAIGNDHEIATPCLRENRNDRLSNNLNISFLGCEAETLVLYLGAKGIACSAGSACSTDKQKSSHVLEALGLSDERVGSAVRFSLGKSTTKKDIDRVMKVLPAIVEKVIKMKQA